MLSDLNSVLIEGEVIKTFSSKKENPDATPEELELQSIRVFEKYEQKTFVVVDVRNHHELVRGSISKGMKIRVVGRIIGNRKTKTRIVAEHIEIKPKKAV
jgi:hypothetical protein